MFVNYWVELSKEEHHQIQQLVPSTPTQGMGMLMNEPDRNERMKKIVDNEISEEPDSKHVEISLQKNFQ